MKSQIAIAGMFVNGSFVLLSLLFGSMAPGKSPEAELAIKGYDTVAYFTEGKALKGSDAFTADWHGMSGISRRGTIGTYSPPARRSTPRNMTAGVPGQ